MEQGPVMESLRGPSRDLFDHQQTITDVSGAGNNFAYGHYIYGNQYEESVMVSLRCSLPTCTRCHTHTDLLRLCFLLCCYRFA
jgi:tubulin epsilon